MSSPWHVTKGGMDDKSVIILVCFLRTRFMFLLSIEDSGWLRNTNSVGWKWCFYERLPWHPKLALFILVVFVKATSRYPMEQIMLCGSGVSMSARWSVTNPVPPCYSFTSDMVIQDNLLIHGNQPRNTRQPRNTWLLGNTRQPQCWVIHGARYIWLYMWSIFRSICQHCLRLLQHEVTANQS